MAPKDKDVADSRVFAPLCSLLGLATWWPGKQSSMLASRMCAIGPPVTLDSLSAWGKSTSWVNSYNWCASQPQLSPASNLNRVQKIRLSLFNLMSCAH